MKIMCFCHAFNTGQYTLIQTIRIWFEIFKWILTYVAFEFFLSWLKPKSCMPRKRDRKNERKLVPKLIPIIVWVCVFEKVCRSNVYSNSIYFTFATQLSTVYTFAVVDSLYYFTPAVVFASIIVSNCQNNWHVKQINSDFSPSEWKKKKQLKTLGNQLICLLLPNFLLTSHQHNTISFKTKKCLKLQITKSPQKNI